MADGGDYLIHRAVLIVEDILFEFLFNVLACRLDYKRQHIGFGYGVFLIKCEKQMPSYTAVAIQLYADILVFVIRQRDLFR